MPSSPGSSVDVAPPSGSADQAVRPGKVPASVSERWSPALIPAKPLAHLVASLRDAEVRGPTDVLIRDVTYRSALVRPGSLFFCVPGSHSDGHAFAGASIDSGAVALVVERWLDVPGTQVQVPSVREVMGPMSSEFFGRPSS